MKTRWNSGKEKKNEAKRKRQVIIKQEQWNIARDNKTKEGKSSFVHKLSEWRIR